MECSAVDVGKGLAQTSSRLNGAIRAHFKEIMTLRGTEEATGEWFFDGFTKCNLIFQSPHVGVAVRRIHVRSKIGNAGG